MRDNITRIRSIGVIEESGCISYKNGNEDMIKSCQIEQTILRVMEDCGIDAPIVNIYRYDGCSISDYRDKIEESLSIIDKNNCIIISEAYVHADELLNMKPKSTEEDENNANKLLDQGRRLLKSLGFVDIGFYMDDYDFGVPFLYKNELSEKLYDYMHNEKLDKNIYGMYMLLKLNLKENNSISTDIRFIGEGESENFYDKFCHTIGIEESFADMNVEDNEHVKINMDYTRIADMQKTGSSMRPVSQTRDLNIADIKPGTLKFTITDKQANNQVTNMILLDICDTSIKVHWRRYTDLGEHTVASTQFSVANIVKCDLYWKESGIFNIVFHIPDPKTISKPIFTYLLPENEDLNDADLWQSKYINEMLNRAIYKSKGIYCETYVDETMMKKYTFRDMLNGDITYEEKKSLRGDNNVQSDEE